MDIKSVSKSDFNTMIAVNNLNYKNLGDTSLVHRRLQRKFNAKKSEYSHTEKIQFELSTGSSLVYGPNSYVVLKVKANTPTEHVTPHTDHIGFSPRITTTPCSVMNIFSCAVLRVNAKEIDRIDNLNMLSRYITTWTTDSELIHAGLGTVSGFKATNERQHLDATGGTRFVIPLKWFSGLFANDEQLIPAGLINGLTIDLTLEQPASALVYEPATIGTVSYTVSSPEIVLDMYELNDSANLFLKQEASKNIGLVFPFKSYAHQLSTTTGESTLSANVGKPYSHVLGAFTVVRESAIIGNSGEDSLASVDYAQDFPSWRYLFGNQSYPECHVDSVEESYMIAQQTFNKLKDVYSPNSISVGEYKDGVGILAMSFEKMGYLLEQSGMRLNVGGRSLYLDFKRTAGASLTFNTFMSFVKAISVYADGRLVISE